MLRSKLYARIGRGATRGAPARVGGLDLTGENRKRREREAGVPREIHHVKRYWFHADRVAGIDIFKLPEFPRYEVYVSDRFVRRVKRAGLHGFWFERLWSPGDRLPDLRPRRLPG